jgi:hypothetical protein
MKTLHKLGLVVPLAALAFGCAATEDVVARGTPDGGAGSGGSGGSAGSSGSGGSGAIGVDASGVDGGPKCPSCSADYTQVIGCDGTVKETCTGDQMCGAGTCMPACQAASANQSSVGCDYYAVAMASMGGGFGGCFVAFIANTWTLPVQIQASFGGTPIDVAAHARIPKGSGPNVTYEPIPSGGLPPGEVAVVFLGNDPVAHGTWAAPAACPVPAAVGLDAHVHTGISQYTGKGNAFHITTNGPVVAYQMLPYNAAYSTTTGATLLIPTSAWDTNYVAVQAWGEAQWQGLPIFASMNIVAKEDNTTVSIVPKVKIDGSGNSVPPIGQNQLGVLTLNAGETISFLEDGELTGSPIQSNKPIGLFAGHTGLRIPFDVDWSDHAEQQIPPVRALGSEYAIVSYRDRVPGYPENRVHRLIGAVDGTQLSFDPPIAGAPTSLNLGTVVEIQTDEPFVVKSQDEEHPFLAFTYMSGSANIANAGGPAGYGDPDFVRVVAGLQYLNRYVFFTDPTYPDTNLVVVRRKGESGFADVTLDCKGVLDGWQPVGSGGSYQYTRVDLSRGNFEAQGNCNNGRNEMHSAEPFGLTVWGWGSPETRPGEPMPCDNTKPDNSCDVSYGYPAGENVRPINEVVVVPVPH